MTLPLQFGQIFYYVVLPMLLIASAGFVMQRRLGLDMPTLTRLNFSYTIPAFVYFSVVNSNLKAQAVATVVLFTLGVAACLALLTLLAVRVLKIPRGLTGAMLMTALFYNSGNYGIPLQELAFRALDARNAAAGEATTLAADAMLLQCFVMITQNVMTFTLGVLIAAGARGTESPGHSGARSWKRNLAEIARFPPLYALAAGVLTVLLRSALGERSPQAAQALLPFWDALKHIREGFVAVALCTLGAQLAAMRPDSRDYPVKASLVLRLLCGPAIGLALIYAFGLHGFLAQVLLIGTATPTAVNSMLLAMQFDNHPSYVARAVFYATLLSPITVTLVVFLAQSGLLAPLR